MKLGLKIKVIMKKKALAETSRGHKLWGKIRLHRISPNKSLTINRTTSKKTQIHTCYGSY